MAAAHPTTDLSDSMLGMEEVIKEFLVESNEGLDRFDRDLVALEQDQTSRELLDSIFRAIHTIKGTGGMLGYHKLVSVAHVGENVLGRLRDGALLFSPAIATTLLLMADALRHMVAEIGANGAEGDGDFSVVVQNLSRILGADSSPQQQVSKPTDLKASECQPSNWGTAAPAEAPQVPNQQPNSTRSPREHYEISRDTVRVSVNLLDKLMNLVGELVLARNQVLQFTGTQKDGSFLGTAQRLNLITTELQEGVMKTRMQPIGNLWNKLPRMLRDMCVGCGKQVEVEMLGADTELDKTIIEAIKDPLTHIVRNAVDHGIEAPGSRMAQGKPPEGHLRLRAFHEGGQVNIEISDDGAGINTGKLKTKAISKGLLSADQAARMSERELLGLVFAPGLSTAEAVSNLSGRGVGMDVVKTNIERIGGRVDLLSTPGKCTQIKINIPLTLAIIPALVVTSGAERFAIPQVSLVELVRCGGEQNGHGIEDIHGTPVYRLRGQLLPLVYLNRELQLAGGESPGEPVNLVVLQAGDRQFGVVVDEINDTEEIVVKPLSKQLKSLAFFAGATIMGDGRVALILDVLGLARKAHVISEAHERRRAGETANNSEASIAGESWLLFRIGDRHRMAIPLSLVSRLEEFPASQVEHAAGHEVIQYRNQIMPLIRLSAALGYGESAAAPNLLPAIVYQNNGSSVGLVVDEILDITDDRTAVQRIGESAVLSGTAVIQHRVTDLLDVPAVLAAQHLDRFLGVSL